ncbi:MAG: hypothetical protein Q9214_007556, partial [Letrouitia sp. 1 TL-2023]
KPPESPTTARELDFDDDAQENLVSPIQHTGEESRDEVPPPKPPRPVNPQQQAENTLKEAFPSIDASVIKAVLRASGGSIEPAFNALLGMSDPDAHTEPAPPPQPPRRPTAPTSTAQSQLAADEQYARQLAEHYNGPARYESRGRQPLDARGPRRTTPNHFGEEDEKERSFFDDDLPIIRDNIKKGFLETQSKVNSWVTNLRKKIDGEEDDNIEGSHPPPASGYSTGPIGATRQPSYGRKSGDYKRRSTDHERYDADPQAPHDVRVVLLQTPISSSQHLPDPSPETVDEFRFKMVPLKRLASNSGVNLPPIQIRDPHPEPVGDPVSGSRYLQLIQIPLGITIRSAWGIPMMRMRRRRI